MKPIRTTLVAGLFALMLAGKAAALNPAYFNCSSGTTGGTGPTASGVQPCSNNDTGEYSLMRSITIEDEGGSFEAVFTTGYSGGAQSSAAAAQVQGSASSSATNSPAFYDYTNAAGDAAQYANPFLIADNSEADSDWGDQFLARGPTGTGTLQYQVSLVVSGTLETSACTYAVDGNSASLFVLLYYNLQGGSGTINTTGYNGSPGLGYQSDACYGQEFNTTTGIITIGNGQYFSLTTALAASASTFAGYPTTPPYLPFYEDSTASVSNATVLTYIDPITPGATYTDATGATNPYATPGPSAVLSSAQVTIPVVNVGNTRYTNVMVTFDHLVSGPSGNAPAGVGVSYDPATGQMTLPSVTVGSTTYYNVVFAVDKLVAVAGVMGGDFYSGGQLQIPSVQVVGGSAYHDVVVTVGSIVSRGGGMPGHVRDLYDPSTNQLTIAAIELGGTVYTNAIVTVASKVSVGGTGP
jgi:hypothetical protein